MPKHLLDLLEKNVAKFYNLHLPQKMKIFFLPLKLFIKFHIIPRIHLLYVSAYLLEGKEKHSKNDFSVLILGDEPFLYYISDMLFSEKPNIKILNKVGFWKTNNFLKRFTKNTDIVIVKTDIFFFQHLKKKGFIIIPEYGATDLDISDSLEDIHKKFKKSTREDIRKIKEYNYSYEITNDSKKLEFFYHRLYLPFISSRHGKLIFPESMILSLSDTISILLKSRKGFLLLIKEKEKYIAGIVILTNGKIAYPVYMGIETNLYCSSERIGSAIFYYCINWAKENGFEYLRFGDVRPFLNDGILRYKRRWGMHVKLSVSRFGIFCLKIRNYNSSAVLNFLKHNPFMYIDKKQLKGFIFTKECISAEEIQKIYKKYTMPGLKHFFIFSNTESVKQSNNILNDFSFVEEITIPIDTTPNYTKFFSGILRIEPVLGSNLIKISYNNMERTRNISDTQYIKNINHLINEFCLNSKQAKQIISKGYQKKFEQLATIFPDKKKDIVILFLNNYPKLIKKNIDVKKIDYEILHDIFSALDKEILSKEAISEILSYMVRHPTKKLNEVIKICGLTNLTNVELEKIIERIANDRIEYIRQKGTLSHKPLMGIAMKEVNSRADGKTVGKILKKKIEEIINNPI